MYRQQFENLNVDLILSSQSKMHVVIIMHYYYYYKQIIIGEVFMISRIIIKITISLPVVGLKKLLLSTNSLGKLLSNSLLSDSFISQ